MRRGRNYLRKICAVALSANPSVKFAAVLNEKGTLIVAECKSNTNNFGRIVTNMNYLFHQNYILPSLQERCSKNMKVMIDENGTEIEFKTVPVSWDTEVAITPLAEIKGMYLCVYFSRLSRPTDRSINK
ncbi:MAG TPA: hypothetical protein VFG77_04190 [Nitrososphaeraceae archaeon]|nr:hypothetical protein [Nitrososphaeraceae archaeon]